MFKILVGMDHDNFARVHSEPDTTTIAGIVIGILSALLVLVILVRFFRKYVGSIFLKRNFENFEIFQVVLVLYRHFFVKGTDTMNFDNPVYRKTTTEDRISIEKNRYGGHRAPSYAVGVSDEVTAQPPQQPQQSYPLASSIIFHGTLAKLAQAHNNPRPYSVN